MGLDVIIIKGSKKQERGNAWFIPQNNSSYGLWRDKKNIPQLCRCAKIDACGYVYKNDSVKAQWCGVM